MEKTIHETVMQNLCISCGACVAVCPKECIHFTKSSGMFLPQIDTKTCIGCTQCKKVCPVLYVKEELSEEVETYLLGDHRKILCAASRSDTLRKQATSGGIVTQLVEHLLQNESYDAAYLLDGYHYDTLQQVRLYQKDSDLSPSFKSRYLTVSHEKTIRHMLANPEDRLILVGTSCCVQAITNAIQVKKLNRENYFIIGLFCDKTMHYGVVDYFAEHPASKGKQLQNLYFRTKEAGGWPGNVRLTYSDDSYIDLPNTERMNVKEYFMPERCLYCLDKLNRLSDIAVGDNYIPENANSDGFSSVIIRTALGERIWEQCSGDFEYKDNLPEQIKQSQHLSAKRSNYQNRVYKGLRAGDVDKKVYRQYAAVIHKMEVGKQDHCYSLIKKELQKTRIKKKLGSIVKKLKRGL